MLYRAIVLLLLASSSWVLSRPIFSNPAIKQLDNFLKAVNYGEPDAEFDEVSADGQNSWELSGKFEGDIVLSDRQQNVLLQETAQPGLARNGLNDASKRWPDNTLVYSINKNEFTGEQVQAIQDGMADLARSSCLKFREKGSGDEPHVRIQGKRRGCYSQVGYQGGSGQILNLSPHPVGLGCMSHGTIVHEMLHSLGFFHMQSHTKRDDYVKILWDNILQGRENNFKKYNSFVTSDFGVPYDYDSVLHYSATAFSKNGRKTIVPITDDFVSIGQRVGLSEKDVVKLNRMYKCDGGGGGGGGSSGGGLEPFSDEVHDGPSNKENKYSFQSAEEHSRGKEPGQSNSQEKDSSEDFSYGSESDESQSSKDSDEFWSKPLYDFPKSYEFKAWWEKK